MMDASPSARSSSPGVATYSATIAISLVAAQRRMIGVRVEQYF
jgi:hypothetical protein